jgi:hypothetical protein
MFQLGKVGDMLGSATPQSPRVYECFCNGQVSGTYELRHMGPNPDAPNTAQRAAVALTISTFNHGTGQVVQQRAHSVGCWSTYCLTWTQREANNTRRDLECLQDCTPIGDARVYPR